MKGLIVSSFLFLNTPGIVAGTLSLSEALKFLPEKTTKRQITQTIGKPNNIITSKDSNEVWEYREESLERLTIFFKGHSETASSWTWAMDDKDSEKDLKTAKARFPNAVWNVETEKWINPHFAPMECFYKDNQQGISLEFNLRKRQVYKITRWNPERKLASQDDEKHPEFCIDGACSPGIPAKDFFKNFSVAQYCEETH